MRDPIIAHNRLSAVALAVAGFVALVLIGLWARHSQETATLDSSYERGYPSRSINVAVPFPAGGPSDVVARVVTEQMGNIGDQVTLKKTLSAANLQPGVYKLQIKVNDNISKQMVDPSTTFSVE